MSEHEYEENPDSEPGADAFAEIVVEQLESLQTQINELRGDGTPTLWPRASNDMTSWVEGWLAPTFDMHTEIRNWQDMPPLVSELTALWVGYNEMTDAKAKGFDPLVWHSHLASARIRMQNHRKQYHASSHRRTDA